MERVRKKTKGMGQCPTICEKYYKKIKEKTTLRKYI